LHRGGSLHFKVEEAFCALHPFAFKISLSALLRLFSSAMGGNFMLILCSAYSSFGIVRFLHCLKTKCFAHDIRTALAMWFDKYISTHQPNMT